MHKGEELFKASVHPLVYLQEEGILPVEGVRDPAALGEGGIQEAGAPTLPARAQKLGGVVLKVQPQPLSHRSGRIGRRPAGSHESCRLDLQGPPRREAVPRSRGAAWAAPHRRGSCRYCPGRRRECGALAGCASASSSPQRGGRDGRGGSGRPSPPCTRPERDPAPWSPSSSRNASHGGVARGTPGEPQAERAPKAFSLRAIPWQVHSIRFLPQPTQRSVGETSLRTSPRRCRRRPHPIPDPLALRRRVRTEAQFLVPPLRLARPGRQPSFSSCPSEPG